MPISYSLEKKGFVGISPHSEAPDLSYHESRFFVTWTQNDVIEASTSHELELIQSNSSEVQFGSVFELQGRLCPSPPQVSTHEVSYDDRTGAMVLDGPGSLIIVNHFSPIHSAEVSAQERRLVEHNTTASFSENVCETPFAVSSQILWLSGKWQVTADAYWMQGNDTTHVYQ